MSELLSAAPSLLAFAGTLAIHGTLLLGLALLAGRIGRLSFATRETLLRIAIFGSVVSASLAFSLRPAAERWSLPGHHGPAPLAAMTTLRSPAPAAANAPAAARASESILPGARAVSGTAGGLATTVLPPRGDTPSLPPWSLLLLMAQLSGAAFLFVRDARSRRRLGLLLRHARPSRAPRLLAALEAARTELGLARRVRLFELEGLDSPFCRGVRAPAIYVDPEHFSLLSGRELVLALRHELLHIRRHDALWRLGVHLLQRLCWWQPLLHVAERELARLAELRCDDHAAHGPAQRLSLARLLLDLAERRSASHVAAPAPAMARPGGELRRRVEALLRAQAPRSRAPAWLAFAPLFVVAALAPALRGVSAQEEAQRASVRGVLRGNDGRLWPEARVTLAGRTLGWCKDIGELDVVHAKTDARGRFSARILPGRSYSVWGAIDLEEGRQHCSEIGEDVVAGELVMLHGEGAPRAPQRCVLTGLAPWRERGAVRATLFVSTRVIYELPLEIEGEEVVVPPFAGPHAVLLVRDARDLVLAALHLTPSEKAREHRVEVPAPVRIVLEAVDAAGAAAPATRLLVGIDTVPELPYQTLLREQMPRVSFAELATTDRDGRAELVLPGKKDGGFSDLLCVQAWHDAHSVQEARGGSFSGGEDGSGPLRITLEEGKQLRGQLLRTAGEPAARVLLVVQRQSASLTAPNTYMMFDIPPEVLHTDAEGRYRIASLHGHYSYRVWAVTEGMTGSPWRIGAVLLHDEPRGPAEEDVAPVCFDDFVLVEMHVKLASGAAARAPLLSLLSSGVPQAVIQPSDPVQVRGSRNGTIRTLLRRQAYGMLVHTETDYALLDFEPGVAPQEQRELKLQPMARLRGRVIDRAGEPVAGAQIAYCGYSAQNQTRRSTLIAALNQLQLHGGSNDEGEFELRFVPSEHFQFRISARVQGATSNEFEIRGGDQDEVVLRVGR